MKNIFNPIFIRGNETLFYVYIAIISIIILITAIFVIREIKKK